MNARHTLFWAVPALAVLADAGPAAAAARDPFWPIGYSHAQPAAEKDEAPRSVAPALPKPEPPQEKPITDGDWAKAKKTLTVSGITRSVNPTTQKSRTLAMINRQMYAAGDTVACVCGDVRFHWRIEFPSDREVSLVPLKAEHVVPSAPLSKQQ